jgi:hypothetical protein
VSSAYFWYFKNPAGGLIEYYADEDQLDADWQPREFEPGPTVFAEWAIDGGMDGNTRRQKGAGPSGKFLTDRAPAGKTAILHLRKSRCPSRLESWAPASVA